MNIVPYSIITLFDCTSVSSHRIAHLKPKCQYISISYLIMSINILTMPTLHQVSDYIGIDLEYP